MQNNDGNNTRLSAGTTCAGIYVILEDNISMSARNIAQSLSAMAREFHPVVHMSAMEGQLDI